MLPLNELAIPSYPDSFKYPVKSTLPDDILQDWEMGGIHLSDTSEGLHYQIWHIMLEIDPDTTMGYVYLEAPNTPRYLLMSGLGISEISLAFDQNMHLFLAYKQSGACLIYWWDPTIPGMATTNLGTGIQDPRCSLDDNRTFGITDSDIILAYVKDDKLYHRRQRDRYLNEMHLADSVPENLVCVGMGVNGRFQFGLGYIL